MPRPGFYIVVGSLCLSLVLEGAAIAFASDLVLAYFPLWLWQSAVGGILAIAILALLTACPHWTTIAGLSHYETFRYCLIAMLTLSLGGLLLTGAFGAYDALIVASGPWPLWVVGTLVAVTGIVLTDLAFRDDYVRILVSLKGRLPLSVPACAAPPRHHANDPRGKVRDG